MRSSRRKQIHAAKPERSPRGSRCSPARSLRKETTRRPSNHSRESRAQSPLSKTCTRWRCVCCRPASPTTRFAQWQVFEQMKQTAGDSGSLHVLFGRAYRDADDMPSAIREFQRAVAIDPRTPHAHYFLGLAQLSLKEWKPTPEAEAELKKGSRILPARLPRQLHARLSHLGRAPL